MMKCGENGEDVCDRCKLLLFCLVSNKQSNPSPDDIASLYCKVTSCYTGKEYGSMKKALEDTIGRLDRRS